MELSEYYLQKGMVRRIPLPIILPSRHAHLMGKGRKPNLTLKRPRKTFDRLHTAAKDSWLSTSSPAMAHRPSYNHDSAPERGSRKIVIGFLIFLDINRLDRLLINLVFIS